MDILFRAPPDLARWESRPLADGVADGARDGDRRDVWERAIGSEPPGPPLADGPHRRAAAAILAYRVFPSEVIRGVLRRSPVEVGDTVGVEYQFLFGIRLFFAARVVARFDGGDGEVWRTGFTYQALVGHPELGEETFSVEKQLASGGIRVALRSWSRPGTLLARLFKPIVRVMQVRGSQRALDQLELAAAAPPALSADAAS